MSRQCETLDQMARRIGGEVFALREEDVHAYFSNAGIPPEALNALGATDDKAFAALAAGVVIGVEWQRSRQREGRDAS